MRVNLWTKLPLFWRFQIGGWLAYLVLSFPTRLTLYGALPEPITIFLLREGCGFLLTLGMREIYRRVYHERMRIGRILALVIAVSLTGGLLLSICSLVFYPINEDRTFKDISPGVAVFTVVYLRTWLCVCWSVLYFGIRSLMDMSKRDVRLAQEETARQRAELQLLRMQMNPHFILNALNALRAEISRPEPRLKELVQALADYLRYSLDNRDRDEVPLGNEFDAIKGYLEVEKARFRDELEIECRMDESARNELVPGVFILPLVDNAIKYGRKTSPLPLRVCLIASRPDPRTLRVEVSNTGHWVDETRPRPFGGVGMENLRHRLDLLYPGKDCLHVLKEAERVTVQVDIPVKV